MFMTLKLVNGWILINLDAADVKHLHNVFINLTSACVSFSDIYKNLKIVFWILTSKQKRKLNFRYIKLLLGNYCLSLWYKKR